jgi:hypothetical protein
MTTLPDFAVSLGWYRLLAIAPLAYVLYSILWLINARYINPLAKIPGPLWPTLSRTWMMWRMYQGDLEHHLRAAHDRYVEQYILWNEVANSTTVSSQTQ